MSCYYDDFTLGQEIKTPGRTITETDVVMYAAMSCDYDERHTNMETVGEHQRRPAPPLLLYGICHGLLCRTGVFEGFGAIAFAGIDDLEFLAPVYVGDTVHGEIRVSEMRLSKSKPDRGMVYYDYTLKNQHGVAVQHSVKKIMRSVRPKAEVMA
jgi:acyl dehydratase